MIFKNIKNIPAIVFFMLCACSARMADIKRMEGFDEELFYKRYYSKEPVVITKISEMAKRSSTKVLQLCSGEEVSLTRLPSMQEDLEKIPLSRAFQPCGADCYGVYQNKVCSKAVEEGIDLPEAFYDDKVEELWFSVLKQGVETPAMLQEGHYFRFVSAGVEDWRLITRFSDGIIDLFHQQVYSMKLATGELLYLPPNTLSQHTALTPLAIAVGSS